MRPSSSFSQDCKMGWLNFFGRCSFVEPVSHLVKKRVSGYCRKYVDVEKRTRRYSSPLSCNGKRENVKMKRKTKRNSETFCDSANQATVSSSPRKLNNVQLRSRSVHLSRKIAMACITPLAAAAELNLVGKKYRGCGYL